ncbi:DUF2946 family protein [Stieleria tagensis]|uniref:DUF2946 family protein n=1 Tax=Stieleria tagensis TaxID=2956795 RepID=UPI0036F31E55
MRFIRPVLAAILCVVAALGHAPAWLHVAGCHDCAPIAAEPDSSCGNSCCLHHHGADESKRDGESPEVPHDSDSCAVCQSLACPVGVGWTSEPPSVFDAAPESAVVHSSRVLHELWLASSRPRGPPCWA